MQEQHSKKNLVDQWVIVIPENVPALEEDDQNLMLNRDFNAITTLQHDVFNMEHYVLDQHIEKA